MHLIQLFAITVLCGTSTLSAGTPPPNRVCQMTDNPAHELNPDSDQFQTFCDLVYIGKQVNADHKVTLQEYLEHLDADEVSTEAKKAIFLLMDPNADGVIDVKDDPLFHQRLDMDHDGTVTYQELFDHNDVLTSMLPLTVLYERTRQTHNAKHLDKNQFKSILSSIPAQSTGQVTKSELETAYATPDLGSDMGKVGVTMAMFDTTNDDVISVQELETQFDHLDANHDGKLTITEFIDSGLMTPISRR